MNIDVDASCHWCVENFGLDWGCCDIKLKCAAEQTATFVVMNIGLRKHIDIIYHFLNAF